MAKKKPQDETITTRKLFEELDECREALNVSIDIVSSVLVGVTPLAYKGWRKGTVPQSKYEPALRRAKSVLFYVRKHKLFANIEAIAQNKTMRAALIKERLQSLNSSL